MKQGEAIIKEIYLNSSVQIICAPELIPAPGQYLLAERRGEDSPAAVPIFLSESTLDGFRAAPIIPPSWIPGAQILLRGPIGRGFSIPSAARKIAIIAWDESSARLRGLIKPAFKQGAEVVLVANSIETDLPESIEVQPMQAIKEILYWADFVAVDVSRDHLPKLKATLALQNLPETQILIRAPMPCGGIAECGVCAISTGHYWKTACKDGPVFRFDDLRRST